MTQLSVIVPVYNKVNYIDECLQSILTQTFEDFELILVNDGSTDGSDLKCRQYQEVDPRIKIIDQKNAGVSAARNAGLKIASGTYVGFVDSDDSIKSDMYGLLLSNILKFEADISVCRLQVIGPGKSPPIEKAGPIVYNHDQALLANLKGDFDKNLNNKIYRTELCKGVVFEGSIYEDILYTAKLFIKSRTTVVENLIKYNYILRDNSVSLNRFNVNYMQTIDVSSKIVSLVSNESFQTIEAAKAFDFETNLSMLNLIILQDTTSYSEHLKKVKNTLLGYESYVNKNNSLTKKHKYAYKMFQLSLPLYRSLMYMYCRITKSDVIKRSL